MAKKRWMQAVSESTEKRGRKGALHRALGIPLDQKIPWDRLVAASKQKGKVGQMARMAMRYRDAGRRKK